MTEREVPDHAAQLKDAPDGLRPQVILGVEQTGSVHPHPVPVLAAYPLLIEFSNN